METKKMTDAFGDKALSSWTPSGIQSTLSSIERTFQNCNQELAALQMGDCDYVFQAAAITEMTENMGYLQTYASSAPAYVYETLDQPLFENFKNNATETLSQIVLDDLETENTIGMEEHFAVSGKGTVYNSKRVKTSLKFEDFLGLPAVEAEEGMPVLENVETVNEFAFLFRTDYDKMGQEDIETCIEAYLTAGEFNHTAYHPVKDFLSGLLDITIVKPLIESVTGYDMITGERLTEAEKNMKLMGACVDLFTFGQGMLAMKGAGLAGKQLCKALGKEMVVDFFANTEAYTMNYGCGELGVPTEIIWLLSVATGCTVTTAGNKFLVKDMNGDVAICTVKDVIENLEGNNLTDFKSFYRMKKGTCNSKSLEDINTDCNVIEKFEKMYGFTEEEALLLTDTIEKLGKTSGYESNSAPYINYVYGTLSTLCISYDARRWRMTALTPNLFQAKNRLYVAGLNSQQILDLQVLINLQHGDFSDEKLKKSKIDITKSTFCDETHAAMMARCNDQNNDFSHQTIQIAAFACEDMMLEEDYILYPPWAIALFNSSDCQHSYTKYEISFKGDIDSGRYSEADFQSDVDAINIYNRMRDDSDSSLNRIWTEYYSEIESGDTNRATEFFCNLGNGEEDIGILELDNILKKETFGSEYIQNGNDMSKEDIDKANKVFVDWIFSEYAGSEYEFPK